MKKWMVVASVLGLLVCGAAMLSYAQGPGSHGDFAGGPGHGRGMGMMLHELNLTDAQKAQVKQIMQANHATMKMMCRDLTASMSVAPGRPKRLTAPPRGAASGASVGVHFYLSSRRRVSTSAT